MGELSVLISRLQDGVKNQALYIKTIRHPQLLIASLQELRSLIGNDNVKDAVASQISHLIMMKTRAMENKHIKEDDVMLNTVLYGPPGVGKTLIGAKLAKIWYSLGYLDGTRNAREKKAEIGDMLKDFLKDSGVNNGTSGDDALLLYIMFVFVMIFITILSMAWSFYSRFGGAWTVAIVVLLLLIILVVGWYVSSILNENQTSSDETTFTAAEKPVIPAVVLPTDDQIIKVVTRADFVDRYVGWSDKKTLKLLQENLGKVLFVDEAYSLVTDAGDTFGIEVLTAINLFLSQHSREIIVIFAGYKDLMEHGIFSFQPGLKRRFMWQFNCNGYNNDQMFEIFTMQLKKKGWGLTDPEETKKIFHNNRTAFPAFGGDTEKLTFFSELEHSRDFLKGEGEVEINRLAPVHVLKGVEKLRENNIQSDPEETNINPLANMMKLLQNRNHEKSYR